ncbi:hypothetical protein CR159_04255 [Pollutimonas subterranea]|uniref:IrrE N-terminal-like domain-containing protein n=1 Tax=Pollutimonas subterranea TaxID=2045210 RepID=A0A2N4U8T0_9BURK|nr:hypothetical protein [Pollutimonas subterranea]PLC51435.1 hypothetical protein CR159_04255 [Pollutimonas subterranea]
MEKNALAATTLQNRLDLFEDCASAVDHLFKQALVHKQDNAFLDFLNFIRNFDRLSVYNAMLVQIQRPGATAVGTRRRWAAIDRNVNPDAIPIIVLQPFGPVSFLYELGDTSGRPIRGQEHGPLKATGKVTAKQFKETKLTAQKLNVEVVDTNQYGLFLAGTAAAINQLPERLAPSNQADATYYYRVKLNAIHDDPTRFATLAHELGHIYCGHLGAHPKGLWPARTSLSIQHQELEAEAVAWLVCRRTGVQPRSEEYLSALMAGVDMQSVSMYAIFEAANRVEARTKIKKQGR